MRWIIFSIAIFVLLLLIFFWNKIMPVSFPEVVFLPEMQPLEAGYTTKPILSPLKESQDFYKKWNSILDFLAEQITTEKLMSISRWAKEEMKAYILPEKELKKIIMDALESSEDGRYIHFSQKAEQGLVLPSHSPVVFRRMVLYAVYDIKNNNISKVYVTIRGWAEE